jgi:hypothetical protein
MTKWQHILIGKCINCIKIANNSQMKCQWMINGQISKIAKKLSYEMVNDKTVNWQNILIGKRTE